MSDSLRTEVVVVGSGAAGAVVASRLARGGAKVVVLEEGRRLTARSLDGEVGRAIREVYRNAGALLALGVPPVAVQVGCVVGGSTVINGGTCFRTPDSVLSEWSRHAEGAFTPGEMTPYFEQVERDLHVVEVPESLAFAGERRLLAAARQRGDSAGFVRRNVVACQGTGLCAFGCPTGAKQSMELSYIPDAERHGAELRPRTRAARVMVRDGRAVGVIAEQLDQGTELTVHADCVVLAAGALHTPLLLRASLKGRTPAATGRHLHLHPALHVVGIFDEPVEPRQGPIQSLYVNDENRGYVIFGMNLPLEVLAPILLGDRVDLAGLGDFSHTVTLAVMASDHDGDGRVRAAPDGSVLPFYRLSQGTWDSLRIGAAHAAELLLAIGAREVRPTVRRVPAFRTADDVALFRRQGAPRRSYLLGSVHPMGTCRLSADRERGVVGPQLEVHGVKSLYIPDASFFPTSLGVNPQITINAFAMWCADQMMQRMRVGQARTDRQERGASR